LRPAPYRRAALLGGSGGEEIVGLIAGAFGIGEAAGRDEFRNQIELLDEIVVEFAAALIVGKGRVPVGLRLQRVPSDQHRSRLLAAVKLQQPIGKAENGAGRLVAVTPDRLGQGVIRAMRKGIAVDDEKRPTRLCLGGFHYAVIAASELMVPGPPARHEAP
jgi:hypothetical protein